VSPPRVVSLLASATEMVCALGLEEMLVGRSHECDFPASVRGLPVLTAPRFATSVTSAEIDRLVRQERREALSVYRVDGDRLRALRPDLILTQSLCDVCAVSLDDVERAVGDWIDGRPRIVSCSPARLDDVWADIDRVARALGLPGKGVALLARLRERAAAIATRAATASTRPSVACIEWIEPLMAAGNWTPELVALAGGSNLFGEAGRHSPFMTWDDLRRSDPEVAVVMPCGFDLERTGSEIGPLLARPGFSALRAARDRRIFLADGNAYFNRSGPRLIDSLEILAEIVHPELFPPRHERTGWRRL